MLYSQTRIYARSLELVALTRDVMDRLPVGYGFLADQLRRAAASVVLNFAEGAGKVTRRERQCYFRRAKASAYEVAAAIDVGVALGILNEPTSKKATDLVDHIGAMLTKFR